MVLTFVCFLAVVGIAGAWGSIRFMAVVLRDLFRHGW